MIRKPNVPETPPREFDYKKFEKEKKWIQKRMDGELVSSTTPGDWLTTIMTAFIIAFIFGGTIGALFGVFLNNINILFYTPLTVFLILLALINRKYALIEFDLKERMMFYEGIVSFGGEDRGIRYMGPIEVIEGTQLVKHRQFGKIFIRFITKSGYLRVSYLPGKEGEFLETISQLGLIDLDLAKKSLNLKKIVKKSNQWSVYHEEKFDRTEFKQKQKQEKEEKEKADKITKEKRKQQLIARSKERKKRRTTKVDEPDNASP